MAQHRAATVALTAMLAPTALLAAALPTALPAAAVDGVSEVCRFDDDRLDEISGMTYSQRHPGVIYLHNDSSGGPRLYAIDSATCRTLATLTIAGIPARDLEAIGSGRDAKGRPVLWVGDLGDNLDSWPEVRLHRVREPARLVDATLSARTFRFTYPDRPHNAEALLADPGSSRVWVVTKQAARGTIYAVPRKAARSGVAVARPVGEAGGMVTDGAVSPDGRRFALRDYVDAEVRDGLPPGRNPATVYLPLQLQGEAMTWTTDGSALLVAGERDNRLLRVEVRAAPVAAATVAAPSATASASVTPTPVPASARPQSEEPPSDAPVAAGSTTTESTATEPDGNGPMIAVAALLLAAAAGVIATAEWARRRRPA